MGQRNVCLRPISNSYEFLVYFMKCSCLPAFHFPFLLKFTPKLAQVKPRNYWCPFNREGTRWRIALGLAGYAKWNFNVNEQLND